MKKHPADLLWLIRFCIRTSPKLFFFNIFACVEQSLFVFFETPYGSDTTSMPLRTAPRFRR